MFILAFWGTAFRALRITLCQKAICYTAPTRTNARAPNTHTHYTPANPGEHWLMQMYRLLGEDKCREISIKHHAKLAFHAFPYLIAATRLDPNPPPPPPLALSGSIILSALIVLTSLGARLLAFVEMQHREMDFSTAASQTHVARGAKQAAA
jgi:hypothetical protein